MMSVIAETCTDNLPSDYDSSFGFYCTWTCQDWAENGYCHTDWSVFDECVTLTSGQIKDHCKSSCNICGKYCFICNVT